MTHINFSVQKHLKIGVIHKGRLQKRSKIRPPSPLSALGHTVPSQSCQRLQRWLNTHWTVTHGHPVVTRCKWVTAVVTGRTQCWLQAVSRCCLSIYCLYLDCLSLHCCELWFIQLGILSLFLLLSTVHCYTLWTSALVKTCRPPLSALGHTPSPPWRPL